MVRTKQTAVKSSGGAIPRRRLEDEGDPSDEEFSDFAYTSHQGPRTKQTARKSKPGIDPFGDFGYHGFEEDDGDEEDEDKDSENDNDDSEGGSAQENDIRGTLESLLTKDLNFGGNYAFSRTYVESPIPSLSLQGFGILGLPLSDPEAKRLIKHCVQAPFGKGERTVVDKKVRDTWEMDASKISFRNPDWEVFMTRVVKDVSDSLGVDFETSKPRAELYKLLIYETGSHFLPHVDTEKTNGMFATIVVVLPTEFAGGDAHVSHSGKSSVFDVSGTSLSRTSVLAWYTDVMHEIKPIKSGYRVALSYNLLHTKSSPRPSPSASTETIDRMRQVILSWKDSEPSDDDYRRSGDFVPRQIVYQLDHKYSKANLSANALKGSDAKLVAFLDPLAKELGFSLGLANLNLKLTGYPEDRYDGYYQDPKTVKFAAVEESTTTIQRLVDLEGKPVAGDVDFDGEKEVIPHNLLKKLEKQPHDGQEYEGYTGNEGGSLERVYLRTALVIWPPKTRLGSGCYDRRALLALEVLASLKGSAPVDQEGALFDYLCEIAPYAPRKIILPTLSSTSRRWNDVTRWIRAIESFDASAKEASFVEEIVTGLLHFGFSKLSACLKAIIFKDDSNASRFKFLATLQQLSEQPRCAKWKKEITTFVDKTRLDALKNLAPLDVSDAELLITEALKTGGVQRLRKVLIPHVAKTATTDFIQVFVTNLHQLSGAKGTPSTDVTEYQRCITDLLTTAVKRNDILKVEHSTRDWYGPSRVFVDYDATREKTISFIATCLDCDNPEIATMAIESISDLGELGQQEAQARTSELLLPLLQDLQEEIEARNPRPKLPLEKLCQLAIESSIQNLERVWMFDPSRSPIKEVLDAAALHGGTAMFTSTIYPRIKSFPWNEGNWRKFMTELSSRKSAPSFDAATIVGILQEMTTTYAERVNLSKSTLQLSGWKDLLEFCLNGGGISCLSIVLARALEPGLITNVYVSTSLVHLLSTMREVAGARRLSLTSKPFCNTIRTIVDAWVDKVMGLKPGVNGELATMIANLERWNCTTCDLHGNCPRTREMLLESSETSIRLWQIGATARKHVEKQLMKHGSGAADFAMIGGTPQGLVVRKIDILVPISTWKGQRKRGKELLKSIGQENVEAIWGKEYSALMEKLDGGNEDQAKKLTAQETRPQANVAKGVQQSPHKAPVPVASGSGPRNGAQIPPVAPAAVAAPANIAPVLPAQIAGPSADVVKQRKAPKPRPETLAAEVKISAREGPQNYCKRAWLAEQKANGGPVTNEAFAAYWTSLGKEGQKKWTKEYQASKKAAAEASDA